MGQPKGCVPWNKGKKGVQKAWNKGKKMLKYRGENASGWHGGKFVSQGYVSVYTTDHPRVKRRSRKYVFEHILVAEKKIGRYLKPDEVVHHINGIRNDNRPGNLVVLTRAKHLRLHKPHGW